MCDQTLYKIANKINLYPYSQVTCFLLVYHNTSPEHALSSAIPTPSEESNTHIPGKTLALKSPRHQKCTQPNSTAPSTLITLSKITPPSEASCSSRGLANIQKQRRLLLHRRTTGTFRGTLPSQIRATQAARSQK